MIARLRSEIRYRLRALFGRRHLDRELEAEVQNHLELEAAKLVRQGLPPSEARRQAYLAFGGVEMIKEESRSGRGVAWFDGLRQELFQAFRSLRQHPTFSLAVVATLALGIGANAVMFGVVDRLLFRAPPFLRAPNQVHRVAIYATDRGREEAVTAYQYTRYLDLKRWTTSFSDATVHRIALLPVGTGEATRERRVGVVSAAYFSFFDAPPALGRYFAAADDSLPIGATAAVISHAHWQLAFGGRSDVVGQPIQVGKTIYTIIGVAPQGFVGLDLAEPPVAWIPATTYAATFRSSDPTRYYTRYNWGWLEMVVRRKPGVTVTAASADLNNAVQRSFLAELELEKWARPLAEVRPRAEAVPIQVGHWPTNRVAASVAVWVAGVAAIVLLIAVANVINLAFGRTLGRERETAVRLALGVSRGRLILSHLAESLLLGCLGGAGGVVLALVSTPVLAQLLLPAGTTMPVATDGRTLLFSLGLALVAGLATGIIPAWAARQPALTAALRVGLREGTQRRSRLRTALLIGQAALSAILLIGAGLFVRSLGHARSVPLGFDPSQLVVVGRQMRTVVLSDSSAAQLAIRLEERAALLPEVESASRALTVPFMDTWAAGLWVPGVDSVNRLGNFTLQGASDRFFSTAGTRILRGRAFTKADREGAPRVAVVSELMAKLLWPGKEAIGQCMRVDADTMPCTTVVGISEDLRQSSIAEVGPTYYLAIDQFNPQSAYLFLRVRGDPAGAAEAIRRQLQPLMPGDSYLLATPGQEIVNPTMQSWRAGATMFTAFGGLALVLAAIGLYGVIAYDVSRRTRELGVRAALGARRGLLLRMVLGDGLRLAVLGTGIGVLVAGLGARWVEPLLFQQPGRDPLVFGLVAAVLLATAVVASLVPAIRASRLDPNQALRLE